MEQGGFDPPIQHHPYGYSTANRVPAVGRNKMDQPFLLHLLSSFKGLRLDSHVGESGKTLLARDAFIRRSGWERKEGRKEEGRKNGGESQVGFNGHAVEWKGLRFPLGVRVFVHVHRGVLSLWMSFQGDCSF